MNRALELESGDARTSDSATSEVLVDDRFVEPLPAGSVIGTSSTGGSVRKGVDREGVIGIDNGALRIQPLLKSGWGRSGIAYGPYPRRNGLTIGVFMLNGHNTSQAEHLPDGLRLRLGRWWLGTETARPLKRMRRLLRARQRRVLVRRMLHWAATGTRFRHVHAINENLAVGWFPTEAPTDPLQQGNSFVMHALGPECGDLRARVGLQWLRGARGVQNVPLYYFVVLRERGAAYYAASIPHVPNLVSYPDMRPIAIDAFVRDDTVYAGVHQSVLGQIGFRVDSRIYAVQVCDVADFKRWYGSAQVADRLSGEGRLEETVAETGGRWTAIQGSFERSDHGVASRAPMSTAALYARTPSGLVHVLVDVTDSDDTRVGLMWRVKDEDNYWCFEADGRGCSLSIREHGVWSRFPASREHRLAPKTANSMQVSDDGENIGLYLNGNLIYGATLADVRLQDATGIGLRMVGDSGAVFLKSLEAHPRSVPVPTVFDLGERTLDGGRRVVVRDDFMTSSADLAGRTTPVGQRVWKRQIGLGSISADGDGTARVQGTVHQPCPGRTAYTVDWSDSAFADVAVTITPPGTQRGNREKGRGGLIFWQDDDNYVTLSVFVDDWYGTSIAAFFHVDGFEELYDAVWSNVGTRIRWGVPYDFRVIFDGQRFLAFVNDEPVLYRALSDIYPDWARLDIRSVGIVANWEWGNDTGSQFHDFIARDKG